MVLGLPLISSPPVGGLSACSLSEEGAAALRRRAAAVAGRARAHRLLARQRGQGEEQRRQQQHQEFGDVVQQEGQLEAELDARLAEQHIEAEEREERGADRHQPTRAPGAAMIHRSEEHTSELQSLMRISYAVFCLKKKTYMKN